MRESQSHKSTDSILLSKPLTWIVHYPSDRIGGIIHLSRPCACSVPLPSPLRRNIPVPMPDGGAARRSPYSASNVLLCGRNNSNSAGRKTIPARNAL